MFFFSFFPFLSIWFQIQSFSQDHLDTSRYKKKMKRKEKVHRVYTNWRFIDTFCSRHMLLYIIFETIKEKASEAEMEMFWEKKRTLKITIEKVMAESFFLHINSFSIAFWHLQEIGGFSSSFFKTFTENILKKKNQNGYCEIIFLTFLC